MIGEEGATRDNSILVLVVDDDPTIRHVVSKVFEPLYNVKSVESGEEALEFVQKTATPNLILLDQVMPDMTGIETLEKIREIEGYEDTPVVFLTSEDNMETELAVFRAGALDFITKPFVPEIARERIKRIIDLKKLQDSLEDEVTYKSNKMVEINEKLTGVCRHVVKALAGMIESEVIGKKGHSDRVAEYASEIARRMGKSKPEIQDVYLAASLYDIGEYAVPSEILNKPGSLTDEEFAVESTHPAKGAEILSSVAELPILSAAALHHQERFDGTGYPDGLSGKDIPEIARIISVADAYDAMTSWRSYRGELSQEQVRAEIEANKGKQFDPDIADIMIQMIDEDVSFIKKGI
ncbi:MAG: response regulator [Clostridiales bacterium]|nr:response regulator [Clostridiales bacterium]